MTRPARMLLVALGASLTVFILAGAAIARVLTPLERCDQGVALLDLRAFGSPNPGVPDNVRRRLTLARCLSDQHASLEAEALLRAIVNNPRLAPADEADVQVALSTATRRLGRFKEAEAAARAAEAIINGPRRPGGAALRALGEALREQGRLAEAEQAFQTAANRDRLRGEKAELAQDLGALAYLRSEQGHDVGALDLLQTAYGLQVDARGADHPDTLAMLTSLAQLLTWAGRGAEGAKAARSALEAIRAKASVQAVQSADALGALATSLEELGDYGAAETLRREEVAALEATTDKLATAEALSELALTLDNLERPVEARQFYDRSTDLRREVYGNGSSVLARAENQRGNSDSAHGFFREAEAHYRVALPALEARFGARSGSVATVLSNLAGAVEQQGRWASAEPLRRRALDIRLALRSDNPGELVAAWTSLADNLRMRNRLDEAERGYREAMSPSLSKGVSVPIRVNTLLSHAVNLEALGRLSEAEREFAVALSLTEGDDDLSSRARVLLNQGALLSRISRFDDAKRVFEQAADIAQKAYGPSDIRLDPYLADLANGFSYAGLYAEAEDVQRRREVLTRNGGVTDYRRASVLLDLASAQRMLNHSEQAMATLQRTRGLSLSPRGAEDQLPVLLAIEEIQILRAQDRFAEAYEVFQRSVAGAPSRAAPARRADDLDLLADLRLDLGSYAEAEAASRQELQVADSTPLDVGGRARARTTLARVLNRMARYDEAMSLLDQALVLRGTSPGNVVGRNNTIVDLAQNLADVGRAREAEIYLRRLIPEYEARYGPNSEELATGLARLADVVDDQGRSAEAERYLTRAKAIQDANGQSESLLTANIVGALAIVQGRQDKFQAAELNFRRQVVMNERIFPPGHPDIAIALEQLASNLDDQDRYAEAEPIYRRALSISENAVGVNVAEWARQLEDFAGNLDSQARGEEALPFMKRAQALRINLLGPNHPDTLVGRRALALMLVRQDRLDEALAELRPACGGLRNLAVSAGLADETASQRDEIQGCTGFLARTLWRRANLSPTAPEASALREEAFMAAQLRIYSAASDALSKAGASSIARQAGVEEVAKQYEDDLLARNAAITSFAAVTSTAGASVEAKAAAATRLNAIEARLTTSAERLASNTRYWAYRSPAPISVAELQGKDGHHGLLRDDEVLVLFMSRDSNPGLIFAVTRERIAWASLEMTNTELSQHVSALRSSLDGATAARLGFDRRQAYTVYKALLGAPAIAELVASKPVLLSVVAGPLEALPLGVLVTAEPTGRSAGDRNPIQLRATPWLLKQKALASLPSVATLRILRDRTRSSEDRIPFLAIADPVARPVGAGSSVRPRSGPPSDLASALARLPALPGARREIERLSAVVGGPSAVILEGAEASKSALQTLSVSQRLRRVAIIAFATHNLKPGVVPGWDEPGLVLSTRGDARDGVLTASEVAALDLDADLVLLSACDTAFRDDSADTVLSGLPSAFFYAGAHSLLVSNWRVRDEVSRDMTPAILRALKDNPDLGYARALQRAAIAELDNPRRSARPADWAVFSLIGDGAPGRALPAP